jgi:Zn-dependent protease with chaperone function
MEEPLAVYGGRFSVFHQARRQVNQETPFREPNCREARAIQCAACNSSMTTKGLAVGIQVTCASCHSGLQVKESFGGKRGKCPKCGAVIVVPLAAVTELTDGLAPGSAGAEMAIPLAVQQQDTPALEKKRKPRVKVERDEAKLLRSILGAFEGEMPRVRRTFGYRLGIVLITFALLMLPVVYLLLVGGVGFFVFWHATHNLSGIASLHNIWALVFGYAGPLIAGVILIFFMIKPLFAPVSRSGAEKVLERHQEPVLFAFVDRIARAVGAPEPRRIQVNCEVNASAGLGRGLLGLFSNQLELTIGLPLVAGLSARQLAGVVAHELGHFTQGAGMRFSYIVRSVNHWFIRIVYERDGWDERLVHGCQESGRLTPIFLLALFCVWLTRRVLWVLMIVGHVLSCFLTRQMEYDADRFMARIAGSETFEEIARRLELWGVSSQATFSLAGHWWLKDRYPDDLPTLIVSHTERIPKKLHRKIQKNLNKSRTGIFDSHPCLKDRMANVGREATDGIFHFDGPATMLPRGYSKLARQASLKLYQAMFGRHVTLDQLISVVDLEDSGV